jgi:hypothetical protein
VAVSPLPVIVPLLLHATGIASTGWSVHVDHITIAAHIISFPPTATWFLLGFVHIAMTIVPVVALGKLREALARSERRNFMHAWHLRQLAH